MKKTLIEKYQIETGDLFFVVGDAGKSTYQLGDFLLIKEADPAGVWHRIINSRTLTGDCTCASGGTEWLTKMLQAGIFEYQGNVKA